SSMIPSPFAPRRISTLMVFVLAAPLAACLCGDQGGWSYGGTGKPHSGKAGAGGDSAWPAPTPPNGDGTHDGGAAGASAGGTGNHAGAGGTTIQSGSNGSQAGAGASTDGGATAGTSGGGAPVGVSDGGSASAGTSGGATTGTSGGGASAGMSGG